MKLEFDNPKHEMLLNDYGALCKRYDRKGERYADEILAAIEVLRAADALSDVPRGYRPHPLRGEYKGCFAINVTKKYRVILRPNHADDPGFRIDNPKTITQIVILQIFKDYHD